MASPLVELQKLGQSPWHDNIRRELLTSGKLQRMVADGDITGLTSNPTIFEKAIGGSNHYDKQLRELALRGQGAEEIFDALAIDDIRNAADVFRPVFDRTNGIDGYVSIEVAPRWANDTQTTIREAHRLWETVDRPNLMIKIPGTRAGLPAVRRCIADGLNINVTLIFSLDRYDEVMDSYLRGLIDRLEAGKPVSHIASVASFFVSRLDTAVDKLLEERLQTAHPEERAHLEGLKGQAAIANAKLAYAGFRKKFSTEAAMALENQGARRQRPLWASTSTKNPAYPDVYYVEALVGPDTVNTLPPATIDAYRDHGRPEIHLDRNVDQARRVIEDLESLGIRMDAVTKKLEEDGVASFAKSFDSLIAVVEKRREAILAKTKKTVVASRPARRAKKASSAKKPGRPKKAKARPAPRKSKPTRKPKARAKKTALKKKTSAPRRRKSTAAAKRRKKK